MKNLSRIALFTVGLLLLTACTTQPQGANNTSSSGAAGSSSSSSGSTTTSSSSSSSSSSSGSVTTGSAEYSISMAHLKFSLTQIEAEPGQTVVIKLKGTEGEHDFVIDELDVSSNSLSSGETQTLTFTIPASAEAGDTYEYYCSTSNHRQLGMTGTLRIV